jgi:hypothetical protein
MEAYSVLCEEDTKTLFFLPVVKEVVTDYKDV